MIHIFIPFRVQENAIEEAHSIIARFIEQVRQHEDHTMAYSSWQMADDPTSFFHTMTFASDEAHDQHRASAYVQEFVERLYPICTEKPKAKQVVLVNKK
ncbi:antibiotic biosynthesis monooxygenase [Cytophagales bacterium LB-30]|uniref:Antibiotic biosynthesis monooxygenase n=1 Tax=Shiella aurantiaca TaxID=3058365 RepID=A0ABT8F0W6_9BACT|nr:antibiotic biosynthesis monooxygenase [Shiella aurantiaca]MDN4163923.1 antibiotic biosynthesis monooxygenase [Shiella aurantiaca]